MQTDLLVRSRTACDTHWAVLHSDQKMVQLSESKLDYSVIWKITLTRGVGGVSRSPKHNPDPTLSSPTATHLCHSRHFSQEIQEGGGKGDLLWDTRKYAINGEGEVSTGLLSRGGSCSKLITLPASKVDATVSRFEKAAQPHISTIKFAWKFQSEFSYTWENVCFPAVDDLNTFIILIICLCI